MAADDLSIFFDDDTFAEDVTVDGVAARGIFSESDEVALDEAIVNAPTLRVRSTVAAPSDAPCVIRGVTYSVRTPLKVPPDGAVRLLVLAKV